MLIKGAPAVIQDLKELYSDRQKAYEIEKVLLGFRENMSRSSVLEPSDEEEQDPTVWVWLLYFLANHYLFTRQADEALSVINEAISHTPTLLDLYTMKGKIMQLAGDRTEAAKLFEEARVLDQADRALNAIAACYQVKAGNVEQG